MKRIVIAADGSPGGSAAVDAGLELAGTIGGVATIVCVRDSPPLLLGDPYYARKVSDELRDARDVVDDAARRATEAGVESESEILEGDAAEQILTLAHSRNADVIVVGSRGRGALAGAVLGSVSSAIVHGAECPVLVVKEKPAATQPGG